MVLMRKKTTLTYLQVKSTADKILLTGERPTLLRVYNLFGKVATKNELSLYLRRWREERRLSHHSDLPSSLSKKRVNELIEERTSELKKSLSLVRATLESTEDGILLIDNEGKLVDFNQKFIEIARIPKTALEEGDEEIGLGSVLELLEHPEEILELIVHLKDHPEIQGDMGEVRFKDGRIIERYSQPQRLGSEIVGRVWSFRDVTERRKSEEAVRLRDRAIKASSQGILILANDEKRTIQFANPAYEAITQYKVEKTIGKEFSILNGEENNEAEWQELMFAMQEHTEGRAILCGQKKNGDAYWSELSVTPVFNKDGSEVEHFVVVMKDITERKNLEEQLMHQTTHDTLTDLPNRVLLEDRIRQMLLYAGNSKQITAILFLDVDHFKLINVNLGHVIGDELIKKISQRLRDSVRRRDTVARVGGDEFVVVLLQIRDLREVERFANKILEVLQKPFSVAGHELNITVSIGISLFPKDGKDTIELIRNADTAKGQAKEGGRNKIKYYEHEMSRHASKVMEIEHDLQRALQNQEFEVYYQPILDLMTHKVISVEALIRWNHPRLGLVTPGDFIYIAEETGLIVPIGEWILTEACRQCVEWDNKKMPAINFSVNVSSRQLKKKIILAALKRVFKSTGMNPERLTIEITESLLMEQVEETIELLKNLRRLGVRLSIDDFGTGYSSLSYLKQFPVNYLKIDQAFVRDIVNELDSQAIVTAIIAVAKALGLATVAEGAETLEEMQYLATQGCDMMQGYYFSRPLTAKNCEMLILENYGLLRKIP